MLVAFGATVGNCQYRDRAGGNGMLPTTIELDMANQDRPHQTVPPKAEPPKSGGGNRVGVSLRLPSPLHAHVGMQ